MVVTRRDIGCDRSERIERGAVTLLYLLLHVLADLVHGHMARTFHDHLYVMFPCLARELPEYFEFEELGPVVGIVA